MKPRNILVLFAVYVALVTFVLAYYEARGITEPDWSAGITMLVSSLLIFWWYKTDSRERGYRGSSVLGVAIILAAILGIPYYLFRSRESGERLRAFGGLFGFMLILIAASTIPALPFAAAD